MPIPVTITLNSIVGTPGPFNLYSNTDNYTTAFETGVSASGNIITSTNVPDGTTIIKIKSTGVICTYEITKSIVGLPTVTPTTIPTSTPTPTNTNTPTPTVTCVNCSTSTVTSGTTNSGFLLQTHCLDLSSASNGATIFIGYQAYSRLNRFYVFENGLTTVSGTNTGWIGTDNTYSNPPYNSPGSPTGTISFTYDSSKTYELKVEIAPENPSNPENYSYEFTLTCGGVVTFTPTPTSTLTPTATPYRIVANDLWVGDPGDVEFGDNTSCEHTSPINTVHGAVDAWLYSATNICDATSLETDFSLGYDWVLDEMLSNEYIWISQTGITYDSTLGSYVRLYKRSGSTNTLLVNRFWMGTLPGIHSEGAVCERLKGDYNIVQNKIHFYDAPYGKLPIVPENPRYDEVDYLGIQSSSSFSGRIFNKSGTPNTSSVTYSDNILFLI